MRLFCPARGPFRKARGRKVGSYVNEIATCRTGCQPGKEDKCTISCCADHLKCYSISALFCSRSGSSLQGYREPTGENDAPYYDDRTDHDETNFDSMTSNKVAERL